MLLSKTCDYAIRAALYIAVNEDRQFVPIREISEQLNISFHFLTKILQILTQKDIMASFKGPKGGIALARPAGKISVKEIVLAVDGPQIFENCLLGLEKCGEENPCPLHEQWAAIRSQLNQLFEHTTLAEMAEKVKSNKFRMANVQVP